jgi:hypothetical protein
MKREKVHAWSLGLEDENPFLQNESFLSAAGLILLKVVADEIC